jgi:hypothetical protein
VKREQERGREESDLPSMCAFAKLPGPMNFQNYFSIEKLVE